jgi:acid phosphatase type 7
MKNLLFLLALIVKAQAVDTIYATYGSKPQSEVIIRYIDDKKQGYLFLKKEGELQEVKGDSLPFGKSHYIHRWQMGSLSPGQKVTFFAGATKEEYSVSTLKEGDVEFVVAGDLYRSIKPFREGIMAMASEDPDFVIFGGDLAYTSHGPLHFPSGEFIIKRYKTFFQTLASNLKKKNGELIPIITAVGNHDYKKGSNEYVIDLFFPPYSKTYFHYDLGEALDVFILDTGHVAPMSGLQLGFLKQGLSSSKKAFKIAVYHIGAYPSVYSYESNSAKSVREAFCPIFDDYQVQLAFEHHSHAFKVTHPIKNNVINEEGTIYLGDGCVGVKPRNPKNKKAWYMQDAQAERHYFKVSLTDTLKVEAKNLKSEPIHPVIERSSQKASMNPPQTAQDPSDQKDSETKMLDS